MACDRDTTVITGANGSLGQVISAELVARNVQVVAVSRQAIQLNAGSGWQLIGEGCDLATSSGAEYLFKVVSRLALTKTSIVNCVGYFPGYEAFLDIDYVQVDRTIQSNFTAVYFTALSLIPLVKSHGGNFITFTSLSTPGAYPLMTAFDSSKIAVEQLTRHIANEFGGAGVQANTIALATLKTIEEIQLKPHGDHDHWVDPKEVADFVLSLIEGKFGLLNGTTLKCYHYSRFFYKTSYFDRVSK